MTLRGIEHFPDLGEWTEEDIQNNGYRRFSISIFDHWLNREDITPTHMFPWSERVRMDWSPFFTSKIKDFVHFIFASLTLAFSV